MKRDITFLCGIIVVLAVSFGLLACPQSEEEVAENAFSLSLDKQEYSLYIPTGAGFIPPEDLKVKVTNTGKQPTGEIRVVLANDENEVFELSDSSISSLLPGESASFKVLFPKNDPGGTTVSTVDIVIGNRNVTKRLPIKYGIYSVVNTDITFSPSILNAGGTAMATTTDPEKEGKRWFSGTPNVAAIDGTTGTIKLLRTGEAIIGFIVSEDPLVVKGKKVTVYPGDMLPSIINITQQSDDVIRMEFDEPVTLDLTKMQIKSNDVPRGDLAVTTNPGGNAPLLDYSLPATAIRTVASLNGSAAMVGTDGKTWDVTLWTNPPFAYNDILRLVVPVTSARDTGPVEQELIAPVPQYILRNPVKRTKAAFETTAGLYRNGTRVTAVDTGDANGLFQRAIDDINQGKDDNDASRPKLNEVITIVLDTAQNFTASSQTPLSYGERGKRFAKLIVTTVTGTTTDITINVTGAGQILEVAGSLTMVIDEHIVFDGSAAEARTNPAFFVEDGGTLILDGGEIRNFTTSSASGSEFNNYGAIVVGGGNWGGYVVVNSGKITGNQVTTSSGSYGGAGGIVIRSYGAVFMHGGEISNNLFSQTGAPTGLRAGAVVCSTNNTPSQSGFFMTGGEIYGNKVEGTGEVGSAGGVLVNGAFQKTGGTIYGSNAAADKKNSTGMTGKTTSGAVAVVNETGINPAQLARRDNTSEAANQLFIDSYKPASGTGVNKVSDWVTTMWD